MLIDVYHFACFFFFQAEDGIRDLVRSRGLGDVYKRQGYIGLELGSVYRALGTKVSVVEMMPGLLPGADRDLVNYLSMRIKKSFAEVMTKSKAVSYTHLRAHETVLDLVCRLLLEKKNTTYQDPNILLKKSKIHI